MVERIGGKVDGKLWPDDDSLALNRREADLVRKAILFAMARNISDVRIDECRAMEIRLHNFLSSTEKN